MRHILFFIKLTMILFIFRQHFVMDDDSAATNGSTGEHIPTTGSESLPITPVSQRDGAGIIVSGSHFAAHRAHILSNAVNLNNPPLVGSSTNFSSPAPGLPGITVPCPTPTAIRSASDIVNSNLHRFNAIWGGLLFEDSVTQLWIDERRVIMGHSSSHMDLASVEPRVTSTLLLVRICVMTFSIGSFVMVYIGTQIGVLSPQRRSLLLTTYVFSEIRKNDYCGPVKPCIRLMRASCN